MDGQYTSSDGRYTAEHLKKLLIQFARNNWDSQVGFVNEIPGKILTNASSFGPSASSCHSFVEDRSLQSIVAQNAHEIEVTNDLHKTFMYYMYNPGTEEMRKHVIALLDADCVEKGIFAKHPKMVQGGPEVKAAAIANHILQQQYTQLELNLGVDVQKREDMMKFTYCVQLTSLLNGWPECMNCEKVYFTTATSFLVFIKTLKEQTQHCKIPPENKTYPKLAWPHTIFGDEDDDPALNTDSQNADLQSPSVDSGIWSSTGLFSGNRTPINGMHNENLLGSADRGYDLTHGPWMYRLAPILGQPKPGWGYLKNESDYMVMLDEIKKINKQYDRWGVPVLAHKRCHIIMIHSKDRESQLRKEKNDAEEKAYSAQIAKELRENKFYNEEEDNEGEGWYTWWTRNDNEMKRKRQLEEFEAVKARREKARLEGMAVFSSSPQKPSSMAGSPEKRRAVW